MSAARVGDVSEVVVRASHRDRASSLRPGRAGAKATIWESGMKRRALHGSQEGSGEGTGLAAGKGTGCGSSISPSRALVHGSVLEHAVYTFLFEGISRALTHELVRHRAGFAYSQLSQRFVDESNIAFVLPPEIEEGTPAFDIWKKACEESLDSYRELLAQITEQVADEPSATMRRKRARQAARSLLPNSAETKIVVSANVRAWRHFIELRASTSADAEIRKLAIATLRVLQEQAPALFGDFEIQPLDDGTEMAHPEHSKV